MVLSFKLLASGCWLFSSGGSHGSQVLGLRDNPNADGRFLPLLTLLPLPGGLLESSGWGMVSSQNIDVKELIAIILNANYLAWRRASPLGRAGDRGVGARSYKRLSAVW